MNNQLVLSTFTGLGLLDQGFKNHGFIVVSAGDLILGNEVSTGKSEELTVERIESVIKYTFNNKKNGS